METRALAIALFFAVGTAVGGIAGPVLFGQFIHSGDADQVAIGLLHRRRRDGARRRGGAVLRRPRRAAVAREHRQAADRGGGRGGGAARRRRLRGADGGRAGERIRERAARRAGTRAGGAPALPPGAAAAPSTRPAWSARPARRAGYAAVADVDLDREIEAHRARARGARRSDAATSSSGSSAPAGGVRGASGRALRPRARGGPDQVPLPRHLRRRRPQAADPGRRCARGAARLCRRRWRGPRRVMP